MIKKSTLLSLAVSASLAGCGSTEALLAGTAVAGGIVSSLTSSPDYAKYADTCKELMQSAADMASEETKVLSEAAKTEANGVLLYMAMKPRTSVMTQCALAMPKGFLQELAQSGNLLNFVATVYGINRDSANTKRSMEANKEISIANMGHQQQMYELEAALLSRLAGQTIEGINAIKQFTPSTGASQ